MNPVNLIVLPTCDNCGDPIKEPKTDKDGNIVQKFCDRKCKDRFHNRMKTKLGRKTLVSDLRAVFMKHGLEI